MKKKGIAFAIIAIVCAVFPASFGTVVYTGSYQVKGVTWKYGIGDALGFNENTFKTISKSTTNNNWKDGSVTANGEIGFIESCDPNEDVFIFNNTKIVTDGTEFYETPNISSILDEQRKGAVTRKNNSDFPWIDEVNRFASSEYGTNWGTAWPRPYQPAAQFRIKNNSYTVENMENYNRYTNYETGEVGVQWKDNVGNEWNRRSFASRSDEVVVTFIESPDNQDLDITLSLDHIVEMRNQGTVYPRPDSDYIVTEDEKGYVIGMVGKYPIQNRKGSKNKQETLFARGGWGTATRVITDGTVDYQADKRNITSLNGFSGSAINGANDPKINITGTKSVMLITKVDRQDSDCNNVADVKTELYDRLVSDIGDVISKYSVSSNKESYNKMLDTHVKIHGGMFDNVRIDLCSTDEEKEDRQLTNVELIAKQNSDKTSVNKAFLERIYNNGRFGLICASGYQSTRLGAIWNGTWMPEWSGDFTLDANTNLQISGMNTGNMEDASQGYINFILRMVSDWETDAKNIYGMTDAIKAPPRVDGTGQAGSYHFLDGYPHIYVNGITDWLIIPMFEYWQCYGNRLIKVGKDIDIERNKNVLDLSDEDVNRIKSTGYIDLEKDILYPMLTKTMNFWLQYVDENYYTDGNGEIHMDDGTTISQAIANGDMGAKYLYTPGYSPENSPAGDGDNSRWALAYNTTMDISASRDTLFMARAMLDVVKPSDAKEKLESWEDFESKIPDYMYADKGELKEWATPNLGEKHSHRHISHAYPAWPGYETQDDPELRDGIAKVMDLRSAAYGGKEAPESHGATHKSLVEARLKRNDSLKSVLLYLMTNNYQFSSMMTSHNNNHESTYCTDSAFGIMGSINESLLYSSSDRIEILPTLLQNLDKGSISGLRARCNTLVDKVDWDTYSNMASVTMTPDEDNKIQLRCGLEWTKASINGMKQAVKTDEQGVPYIDLTLKKGVSVTVRYTLSENIRISADKDVNGRLSVGSTVKFNADIMSDKIREDEINWNIVDAVSNNPISQVTISQDGTFTIGEAARGKFLKVYASSADANYRSNEIIINISNSLSGSGNDSLELFGTYVDVQDSDLTVYLSNDREAKNISVIWAAYDKNNKLIGLTRNECSLATNEYKQSILSATWDVDTYKSTLFLWDRDTFKPYTSKIEIK